MASVMAPHAVGGGGSGSVGRAGHGLGSELTEPPPLMPGETAELRAGMVITLEPGFEFAPGRMMVHEENIVITENGCELLSVRAPSELPPVGGG